MQPALAAYLRNLSPVEGWLIGKRGQESQDESDLSNYCDASLVYQKSNMSM